MPKLSIYDDVLYHFQQDVVDAAIDQPKWGLFLDLGIGKTLTSLGIVQKLKSKKIIILVQKSSVLDWKIECEKYFDLPILVPDSAAKFKRMIANGDFDKDEYLVIMKHQSACRWKEPLINHVIKYQNTVDVIVDESQMYKNRKSNLGKFGLWLSMVARKMYLLSGDPLSNTYEDIYNQLRMLGYNKISWKFYSENFLVTETKSVRGMGFPIKKTIGHKNTEALKEVLKTCSTMIKTEEVHELPDRVWQDVHLRMEPRCSREYKHALKYRIIQGKEEKFPLEHISQVLIAARFLSSGFYKSTEEHGNQISRYSSHKIDAVRNLIESTHDDFIIFYNFVEEKTQLMELLNELKIKYFEFNGQTSSGHSRKEYKERKVLLIQYVSGATGLNLQDINRTIFYSPTHSGMSYKQAIKRTHRMGQKRTCFYYRLLTAGTLEADIYSKLEKAQNYTNEIFKKFIEGGNK